MPLEVYRGITQNTSWICTGCGIPNFSTTLFETTMADSIATSIATSNSYSVLSETSDDIPSSPAATNSTIDSVDSPDTSIGPPQHASSPARQPHARKPARKQFRVMITNFQSMRAKRQPFWLQLEELDPDIIIGSETWLHPGIHEREVLPCGYHILARRDRPSSPHGGVIIAARDGILGSDLHITTDTELTAANIECSGKQQLIIASIYRPPSSDLTYMQELRDQLHALHTQHPSATIWIAGDVNLPDIDWNTTTITSSSYAHSISQCFLDLTFDIGSEQMIRFPTRNNNTLDLFLTNRPSLVTRTKRLPGVSDHDAVFVEVHAQATRKRPTKRKIPLWKNADYESIQLATTRFTSSFTSDNTPDTDINTLWDSFKDACSTIVEKNVPSKMSTSRFNQPWITRNIKRMSRRKKRAHRKAKHSDCDTDKARYKDLQKETQHACKKAYNSYVKDIVTEKNPKKLYTFINGKRCESSGVPVLKKGGIGFSDPATKASILNEQFSSVFTQEDTSHIPTIDGTPYPTMKPFTITTHGILQLLRGLDPHKAQGPDNIPTRLLKDFAFELAPAVTLLFQASLKQGTVPQDWKEALVTPIFKKGDRTDPANYRPISLTSVCCKLMEHVIHSQVMSHLEQHDILADQQHGFRKRRSCETQLVLTLQDLASGLDNSEQIDAILLDFSKAFDKVPHQRLAQKLHHYGIRGNLLHWVQSFLSDRSQRVLVEGHTSASASVTSGVPQGSVLGPLLFLLYINDMPSRVSSTTKLFADDSLLYRVIRSARDSAALQEDLHNLEKWESEWQMAFNPSKCETIRITRKRQPIISTYTIHGHILDTVPSGKYLGVTIHEKLSWNDHVNTTAKKANNALAFLRRNVYSCPQDIKAQCYKTLVRPILEYASSAWDPHTTTNTAKLEAVQRRAARFVMGDYRTTSSTSEMIATLGWPTLQQRRADSRCILMYRIIHGQVDIPSSTYLHPSTATFHQHGQHYLLPYCRTDVHRCSFFPAGIRLWNQLPQPIASSTTLDGFKAGLATLY